MVSKDKHSPNYNKINTTSTSISNSNNKEENITILLQVKYETTNGENIYILGSSDSFGKWKSPTFKLKWSPNHIWQGELTLPRSSPIVGYKFVCIGKDDSKRWEEGVDRLLCPSLLDDSFLHKGKYVLDCVWNHFKITFNIYYPLNNKDEHMQIVGEPIALADWQRKEQKPIKMELSEEKSIVAKDGNDIHGRFWVVTVLMKADDTRNFSFEYRYSINNTAKKTAIWEREPNRKLILITDPDSEESLQLVKDSPDNAKILSNSQLNKLDVNFVADLNFNQMGNKKIYIGPYPQKYSDFEEIAKSGITAILNLQTDKDFKGRQIDHKAQLKECESLKVKLVRFPIEDFDENDLALKLKAAGDKLKELLDEGNAVYVHCTAGMSRAAATVIVYLVLYDEDDFTVKSAREFCKKHRSVICPNYDVINKVIKEYKPNAVEVKQSEDNGTNN